MKVQSENLKVHANSSNATNHGRRNFICIRGVGRVRGFWSRRGLPVDLRSCQDASDTPIILKS